MHPKQRYSNLNFRELTVSQRNSSFDSRYKFSAKELDDASGYNYFGARYYDSEASIWLSVDPMADERSWVSPYSYVQNSPVMRVDPSGALDTDSDDWFQNTKTGEVYYNTEMRKGDEAMLGEDWEHLGENGMFTQDEASIYGAEISLIARNGSSIEYNQSNNSINGELMLEGGDAEKFMDKQGYKFTETVRFVEEYSDVTMSPDAQTISDNWSKVVKKNNHRYITKDRKHWINTGSYRESDFLRLNDQRTRTVNYEIYQISNKKGLTKWQQGLLKVGIEVYKTAF